jgi:hypothetical protein
LYDIYISAVDDFTQFRNDHPIDQSREMSTESKADRFCALIEGNEYSKANALLNSSGIAPASADTRAQLERLILQRSEEETARVQAVLSDRSQSSSETRRIHLSFKDVKRALRKLHNHTAAGGSGWRNEFLKALATCSKDDLGVVAFLRASSQ